MNVLPDSKDSIASDLENLARLLVEFGICNDTTSVNNAASQCSLRSNNQFWKYSIDDLAFDIDGMSHIIPSNASFMRILFSIELQGRYYELNSICNPLVSVELNIELVGSSKDIDDVYAAWHFDKHQLQQGDGPNKFIHPEFHFTFGGRRMWEKPYDYGASLILPSPRFTHPPLDGILGIDFVIQNYLNSSVHQKLTQSQEYRKILNNSQYRMWRPYHCAIANHWNGFDNAQDDSISSTFLLPNLIY